MVDYMGKHNKRHMNYIYQITLWLSLILTGSTVTVTSFPPTAIITPVVTHAVKGVAIRGSLVVKPVAVVTAEHDSAPLTATSSVVEVTTSIPVVTPNLDTTGNYAAMSTGTSEGYIPPATLCYSQGNCKAQVPINSAYHY